MELPSFHTYDISLNITEKIKFYNLKNFNTGRIYSLRIHNPLPHLPSNTDVSTLSTLISVPATTSKNQIVLFITNFLAFLLQYILFLQP